MTTDAARRATVQARIVRVQDGNATTRTDELAGEEPLEIRAAGPDQEAIRVAVTMRTPGHDFELAAGFLVTEGLVPPGGVAAIAYCEEPEVQRYNVVTVRTRRPFDLGEAERRFFATSSCGICGKGSLEAVALHCPSPPPIGCPVDADVILALPDLMREAQSAFDRTGGLHAAALFGTDGELVALREDVGRHNAVDKIVGATALGTIRAAPVLLVSGRLSFEIVQKAAMARIPIVCAVSAPSSLAVQAADELGLTAIGFLRPAGFNIYAHPERIAMCG